MICVSLDLASTSDSSSGLLNLQSQTLSLIICLFSSSTASFSWSYGRWSKCIYHLLTRFRNCVLYIYAVRKPTTLPQTPTTQKNRHLCSFQMRLYLLSLMFTQTQAVMCLFSILHCPSLCCSRTCSRQYCEVGQTGLLKLLPLFIIYVRLVNVNW